VKALERMTVLDQHVAMMCRHGFAVTAQIDPFTADIRERRPPLAGPGHPVYLILTLVSFGFGVVLWLAVIRDHARQRRRHGTEPFHAGTWRIYVAPTGEVETYELLTDVAPSARGIDY
jgi:hypothetical protein